MTSHIHGSILVGGNKSITCNNRGETEGNRVTIQKILRGEEYFPLLSSDSLRRAIRVGLGRQIAEGGPVLRTITRTGNEWPEEYAEIFKQEDPENLLKYMDLDTMGYMSTEQGAKAKARKGVIEITPAIGLAPWNEAVVHHFASAEANAPKKGAHPTPFSEEVYMGYLAYSLAFTPDHLHKPTRAQRTTILLNAIRDLGTVGGNHSRYYNDFSPKAIVFQVTHRPANAIQEAFEQDPLTREITLPRIAALIAAGDLDPSELVVAGVDIAKYGQYLATEFGVSYFPGILAGFATLLARISQSEAL